MEFLRATGQYFIRVFIVASLLALGSLIVVSRDSIVSSFLEYNLRMLLRGDGFLRSVQSLDIRLVDRIPAFTWSTHANGALEFVNQRCNPYWTYVCAIVLPQQRGQA